MMEVSKTDLRHTIRLLHQAERFYNEYAVRIRDKDKPRQLRNMIRKLNKKLENE